MWEGCGCLLKYLLGARLVGSGGLRPDAQITAGPDKVEATGRSACRVTAAPHRPCKRHSSGH